MGGPWIVHYAIRVGDWMIDLTAAQFGPAYGETLVVPFEEYRQRWGDAEGWWPLIPLAEDQADVG